MIKPSRSPSAITRFFQSDAAGGVVLMIAAVAAMLVANSPWQTTYLGVLHSDLFGLSVEHWVNDGLMAVFFLMVGLEIKRELLTGALSSWSQRALPGFAAVGGMVVPALIYVGFNWNSPQTLGGWAIPAATDIAFALGVLALLGPRVPVSLKIFLAALAILDDLGAVVIITLFHTTGLSIPMLLSALAVLAVLFVMNRMGVQRLIYYVIGGVVLWIFVYQSGVHATLAGVALAFCIPLRVVGYKGRKSPLVKLEHGLHPWVAFAVVPIFGFANAGVSLAGFDMQHLVDPVPLGVALGLFIGKQVGVVGLCALAIKFGLAQLPKGSNWTQLYGVALLCGIGFTMSLFIGSLAFAGSAVLIDEVKIGVLIGSILSGVAGALVVLAGSRK
ncbi:Na+/H+ antiporter NhaA [Actimicrobium antarcticum]|uniref:Na(+)/H(+) antiporter NhaA n=1 Tax=Actimicrobium antarcticum TaxID=1051899 RepID=A0ABP7TN84_9BURK